MNSARSSLPYAAAEDDNEPHHGDLRKGAYLKRRAEYQMQAQTLNATQNCAATARLPRDNRTD
ncbi:MAG: hypothetical protein H6959_08970 [Chromatiaceae bacterium]|nr:hypothetical protein [Gammaproteobacteria bacterium]MCP5301477.1 hypothetical protein [Chromatiaceae bacterium]MCP5423041.1 hypothetical protein [Chromatiaceae bacterium]